MRKAMVTTTLELPAVRSTRGLGVVHGSTVRSHSMVGYFCGCLRSLFGGNIATYTNPSERARAEAYAPACQHVGKKGTSEQSLHLFRAFALAGVCLINVHAFASETAPVWAWHEAGTEIYSPRFSPLGNEVVLVRQRHVPDGAEATTEMELKRLDAAIKKNPRYADPEVVVINLRAGKPAPIGWGWTPAFSSSGDRIAYAHQSKPISGFRVLAQTMEGNEIRLFDRATQNTSVVAKPAGGFLTAPQFSPDGKRLIYELAQAVNGAYGGSVGVASVDLSNNAALALYPATREFGLLHILGSPRFVGNRVMVLRARPAKGGDYLAGAYRYELLDLANPGRVIYSKRTSDLDGLRSLEIVASPKGHAMVHDGDWFDAEEGSPPAGSKAPRVQRNIAGFPSSDGRLVAKLVPTGLELQEIGAANTLRSIRLDAPVQGVFWAPDNQRLAVVVSRESTGRQARFSHDELLVFEVGARRPEKSGHTVNPIGRHPHTSDAGG